jgi:acetyl-CoA synthetase
MVWVSLTHQANFDLREDDIYWCTADVGWVTGHSYIVYGPLANGATSLVFEGVPNWPDASRMWQVCDKHKVSILYTSPTAIRALMREGDGPVKKTSRQSLRVLGSVGEPINPEAWEWYFEVVGESRCPIVDTWWQTETGGILICPLPGSTELKPGAAMNPFYGVQPALVDADGQPIDGAGEGALVLLDSWPGQMRTVYGDHARFIETYFTQYPGMYCSGDGARRDRDGDWHITGRVDDVINVSGHRIGTAEIESAMMADDRVAEAAVVGCPHPVKGTTIYAFVTPREGVAPSDALRNELVSGIRERIGAFAAPEYVQWAPSLPKTRSAKTMRRILRKIAEAGNQEVDLDSLGDTSTLADPSVVQRLYEDRVRH